MAALTRSSDNVMFAMQDAAYCVLNNLDVEVMDCSEAFLSLEGDATGAVPSPYLMLDALGAATTSHVQASHSECDSGGQVPSPYLMLDALDAATHSHRQDLGGVRRALELPKCSTLEPHLGFQGGNLQLDLRETIKSKDETIELLRERVKLLETIQNRDDEIGQLNSRLALLEGGLRGPLAQSCDGAESEVSTTATGPKEVSSCSVSGQSIGSPATSTRDIAVETESTLHLQTSAPRVPRRPNQQQQPHRQFPLQQQASRPSSRGPGFERNLRQCPHELTSKRPVPVEIVSPAVLKMHKSSSQSQKTTAGRTLSLERRAASQQPKKPQGEPLPLGQCTPTFAGHSTPTPVAVGRRMPSGSAPLSRSCASMGSSVSTQATIRAMARPPQPAAALPAAPMSSARARGFEGLQSHDMLSPPHISKGASLTVAAGCMPMSRQGSIAVAPGKVPSVKSAPGVVFVAPSLQATIRHKSPSPSKELDSSSTTGIGASLSSLASQSMPSTARSTSSSVKPSFSEFYRVHNHLALPLMKQVVNLGNAHRHLSEANDLHIKIAGVESGEALYNMACCFALAADAQLQPAADPAAMFRDVSPGLPPANSSSLSGPALVESRVDLAVDVLDRAIKAGYRHVAHMCSDPDFRAVRELRPARFSIAVAVAKGGPILF